MRRKLETSGEDKGGGYEKGGEPEGPARVRSRMEEGDGGEGAGGKTAE